MATTNKIFVQIDNEKIELTGADKTAFLADIEETNARIVLLEAKEAEKKKARESAIKKLAEIAGLTKDELASIL
jgi:glucokinase